MAKWYYQKHGQEFGPVSAADLKRLAVSKQLSVTDRVRRDDMTSWIPATRVQGLFAEAATPPPISNSEAHGTADAQKIRPAPDSIDPPVASGMGQRLVGAIKNAAAVAAKQAHIKAIEWDLHQADEKIGGKAYASSVGQQEYSDVYQGVASLDANIAQLKVPPQPAPAESVVDRTKRVAYEAKKKLEIEGLLIKRNKLLRDFGRRLRNELGGASINDLADDIEASRRIQARLDGQAAELASLMKQGPSPKSMLIKGAAAAAMLFALYWGWGFISSAWAERAQKNLIALQAEERTAETAQRRAKAERATAEREREVAQRALEKTEQDRLRQAEAAARADAAQVERSQFAATEFSKLSMDLSEDVRIAPTLEEKRVTLQLRGPHYVELAECFQKADWLALINLILDEEFTEWPETGVIESATRTLTSGNYTLLLKTSEHVDQDPKGLFLHLVTFSGTALQPRLSYSTEWTRHPDGIGYLHEWKLAEGKAIVVLAVKGAVGKKLQECNNALMLRIEEYQTRRKLGEIDDILLQQHAVDAIAQVIDDFALWAATPSNVAGGDPAADAAKAEEIERLISMLSAQDVSVSTIAGSMEALGRLGRTASGAIPSLLRYLDHEDRRLRQAAFETLGEVGDDTAVQPLLKLVQQPHVVERVSDFTLRTEVWTSRVPAINALSAIGGDAKVAVPTLLDLALNDISIRFKHDGSSQESIRAIISITQNDPTLGVPACIALLNAETRRENRYGFSNRDESGLWFDSKADVVEHIGHYGPAAADAVPALANFLSEIAQDPNISADAVPYHVTDAIRSLMAIGPAPRDALPVIRRFLDFPEEGGTGIDKLAEEAIRTISASSQ